jgi:predicted phosphoadenosine phosphosulfate sulfurtransferase
MAAADVAGVARSLWGKQGEGRDVYQAALARTRFAYDNFDHVFVSFSGGKDSTAVLNVALDVARERDALPLHVVFFDEECISLETVEYAERVRALPEVTFDWYCLPVRHRNACSADEPFWFPWAPEAEDRWVRPLPDGAITDLDGFPMAPDDRYDIPTVCERLLWRRHPGVTAGLLGIRADESITRRKAVSNKRHENYVIPTGNPRYAKVYPVYDWRTVDIWTAPKLLGWDYNITYDLMEMAGIKAGSQRCAPPFGEEPMQNLWMWATCFPDLVASSVLARSTSARLG